MFPQLYANEAWVFVAAARFGYVLNWPRYRQPMMAPSGDPVVEATADALPRLLSSSISCPSLSDPSCKQRAIAPKRG